MDAANHNSRQPKQKCRIVIIGAGIIGTAIAAQFCQSEHLNYQFEIVLIDKYDPRNINQYNSLKSKHIPASWFSPGWINAVLLIFLQH